MMGNLMLDWRSITGYLIMLSYSAMCLILYFRAHRHSLTSPAQGLAGSSVASVMLVYASQTGQAEAIARQTMRQLEAIGVATHLWRIDQPWLDAIPQAGYVLFIVSTYGDGAAPDHAIQFERGGPDKGPHSLLGRVRYGVLALGDRNFPQFCAFGRRLDAWLAASGAESIFPRIDVDRLDSQSLTAWQMKLKEIFAANAERKPGAASVAEFSE